MSDDLKPVNQVKREIRAKAEKSWAMNQLGELPTYTIGTGKKAKSLKVNKTQGIAKILPQILPNRDPRVIPELDEKYVQDMYGGNKLNMVMNKQQIREFQTRQRSKAALAVPLIQGAAFGERSNAQISAQKQKLRAMADNHPADLAVGAGASIFVPDF